MAQQERIEITGGPSLFDMAISVSRVYDVNFFVRLNGDVFECTAQMLKMEVVNEIGRDYFIEGLFRKHRYGDENPFGIGRKFRGRYDTYKRSGWIELLEDPLEIKEYKLESFSSCEELKSALFEKPPYRLYFDLVNGFRIRVYVSSVRKPDLSSDSEEWIIKGTTESFSSGLFQNGFSEKVEICCNYKKEVDKKGFIRLTVKNKEAAKSFAEAYFDVLSKKKETEDAIMNMKINSRN